MARKYYRKRYYRRKGRWSANIKNIALSNNVEGNFFIYQTLCTNPVQNDNTVSQPYTVKNVEFSFMIENSETNKGLIEGCTIYIMYVPQGMNVDYNYPQLHPEYIMAYRYLGSPQTDGEENRNPLKIKTRMARRLQTGDGVIFLMTGVKGTTGAVSLGLSGIVRWWTKAN